MTNQQVREWYKSQVDQIRLLNEGWKVAGLGVEERARRACQVRHDARLRAREMMEDPLEVKLLRKRDLREFGTLDGPTFEFLVKKAREEGLEGDKNTMI
jgi:hypothetical protein